MRREPAEFDYFILEVTHCIINKKKLSQDQTLKLFNIVGKQRTEIEKLKLKIAKLKKS